MVGTTRPVVILGAGINGAALARELTLGGVSVVVVDTADVAYGATAYSSRLIHGGLRYLEYGEFDLVRESLAERTRLLHLAPQFVRPLKLYIPVMNRLGGLRKSVARFVGWHQSGATRPEPPRGLWLVRAGLWLYDRYARDPTLPRHEVHHVGRQLAAAVNPRRYRWLCTYYDAQIRYPERFTLALLADARRAAAESGASFELFTYHRAVLRGSTVEIHRPGAGNEPVAALEPAAIVNATGAWVDHTLEKLQVPSRRLMGGTKGSHFLTANKHLRHALGDHGLYAEAADGRPVFILPFGELSLVGTTDLHFEGDPADAVATEAELDYLLDAVNTILPDASLTRGDIELHYCGVRPLPASDQTTTAAVTRRHWLEPNSDCPVPLYSVVGGKLTTCRSLAESSARTIRARLGLPTGPDSRERPIPGGENYPADESALEARWRELAGRFGLDEPQVRTVWSLCGSETESILDECRPAAGDVVMGCDVPLAFARWVVRHEWVRRLDDLVERRLMLLYDRRLSEAGLRQLAAVLVDEGLLPAGEADAEVRATLDRLRTHFGKRLAPS